MALFMYHSIPCIGACDLGPVIKIKGHRFFSQLTEEKNLSINSTFTK